MEPINAIISAIRETRASVYRSGNMFLAGLLTLCETSLYFVVTFGLLQGLVPDELGFIFRQAIPLSVLLGLVATIIGSATGRSPEGALKVARSLSALLIVLIGIVAAVPQLLPEKAEVVEQSEFRTEIESLRQELSQAGLSERQIQEVEGLLTKSGVITEGDLQQLLLNEGQIQQVLDVLAKGGYVTRSEVLAILEAHSTAQAQAAIVAATATAMAACYVEPAPGYSSINVRSSPQVLDDNRLRFLLAGERLPVVGHNGKTVNVDRWWLVEFDLYGNVVRGWVASDVVTEINEPACMSLQQMGW